MTRVEIRVPRDVTSARVRAVVAAACSDIGGTIGRRMALKTYPGSVHWHVRESGKPGTLEVTWWPKEHRLWLSVQAGRRAAWTGRALPRLRQHLERIMARRTP